MTKKGGGGGGKHVSKRTMYECKRNKGLTLRMIFENSLKISQALKRAQFEIIFKYPEQCKSLIA